MKNLSARQLQWRFGLAFACNVALMILLPKTSLGNGMIVKDVLQSGILGLFAAGALVPASTLLRFGKSWQKAAAVLFLCLPLLTLWMVCLSSVNLW